MLRNSRMENLTDFCVFACAQRYLKPRPRVPFSARPLRRPPPLQSGNPVPSPLSLSPAPTALSSLSPADEPYVLLDAFFLRIVCWLLAFPSLLCAQCPTTA